jgi:hypothetical protein
MGNIVWLASYPKSGNTWMRAFLHNLATKSEKTVSINQLDELSPSAASAILYRPFTAKTAAQLRYEDLAVLRPKAHRAMAERVSGQIFVKTHSFLGESFGVPTITPDVTAGAVYIVRNPLDICLSFSNHTGLSIDETIDLMGQENAASDGKAEQVIEPVRSWSLNVKSWTQSPQSQLCVVRYEDMLDKRIATFTKVAQFLGLDVAASAVRQALRFSSFEELRKQEEAGGFKEQGHHAKPFFNRGQKGQYEEVLSDHQIKALVDAHREQMGRFGYIPSGF